MKLILSLTLLWAFTGTGGAIMCKACTNVTDPNCATTFDKDCPTLSMCITVYAIDTSSGNLVDRIKHDCADNTVCSASGPVTFSSSLGISISQANGMCCNTDLCNDIILSFPTVPVPNRLRCPGCCPETNDCLETVPCFGRQNICFTASVSGSRTHEVSGCATSNLCNSTVSLGFLPFMYGLGNVTTPPFCGPVIPPSAEFHGHYQDGPHHDGCFNDHPCYNSCGC